LHHAEEEQAQEEEGQVGRVEVLQSGRQRQNHPTQTRMREQGVRCWCLHGEPLRPSLLRTMLFDSRLQQARRQVRDVNKSTTTTIVTSVYFLLNVFRSKCMQMCCRPLEAP